MSAFGGDRAPSRATWNAVLGLLLLFAAWGAFAYLAALLTRSLWSAVSSDFSSSIAIALQSSALWIVLLGALLLLMASVRTERGRTVAGAVGLLAGVLGISFVLSGETSAAVVMTPGGELLVDWAAAGAAAAGGALLVATPLLRRHRATPQHLPAHRHRTIHSYRAVRRSGPPRHP